MKKYLFLLCTLLFSIQAGLYANTQGPLNLKSCGQEANNSIVDAIQHLGEHALSFIQNDPESKLFSELIDPENRENEEELKAKHKPLSFDKWMPQAFNTQLCNNFQSHRAYYPKYYFTNTSIRLHIRHQVFII